MSMRRAKVLQFNRGFTLVELVLVVVILSVMAVYVAPRVFDRSAIATGVYQSRAISILRNMQTRAMQDTRNGGYCFKVNFDNAADEFGTPSTNYSVTNDADLIAETCANTIDTLSDNQFYYVTSEELHADNIDLAARANDGTLISSIEFDSLGRANQNGAECDTLDTNTVYSGCRIEFIGDSTTYVCVESEGYVYACEPN